MGRPKFRFARLRKSWTIEVWWSSQPFKLNPGSCGMDRLCIWTMHCKASLRVRFVQNLELIELPSGSQQSAAAWRITRNTSLFLDVLRFRDDSRLLVVAR